MADESTLVDEILEKKPDPSPQIIEQIKQDEKKVEETDTQPEVTRVNPSVPANEFGFQVITPSNPEAVVFDPSIHQKDANGNPIRNNDGTFRKKPGRKSGTPSGTRSATPKVTLPNTDAADMEARAAAEVITSCVFILGTCLGGEEWTPIVNPQVGMNEPEQIKNAWYNYFKVAGNVSLPPWVVPLVATSAYALPRFTQPKTQSRVKIFWNWIKPLFGFKK